VTSAGFVVPSLPNDGTGPRSLLVGALLPAGKGSDPALTFSTGLSTAPTLHDFGIIICRYSNSSFQRTSSEKWGEWSRFLQAGGTGFLVGVEPSLQRHIEKVAQINLRFERESGQELSWKQGPAIFSTVRERKCTKWSLSLSRECEKDVTVFGRNNAGAAVAFEVRLGQGAIVFLPSFDGAERRKLIRGLLRFGEDRWGQHRLGQSIPQWALEVELSSEQKLTAEKLSIENRLVMLRRARRILVDEGPSLSKECYRILQEILVPEGFVVLWKENDGDHDIEMTSSTLTIMAEVRASSKVVNVDVASQLGRHMQIFRPTTSAVKGLLIANAFRNLPPDQRPSAFTPECVALSELNRYCAMTTVQLLEVYDRIKAERLTSSQFLESLKGTAGLYRLPPTRP
jgi:hypothetical protein